MSESEIFYYIQVSMAGLSALSCLISFYLAFSFKEFRLKLKNIFITIHQVSHFFISIHFLLGWLEEESFMVCAIKGVFLRAGMLTSVLWFAFMAFYYFFRYYLKATTIGRYIMCVLTVVFVVPISAAVLRFLMVDFFGEDQCKNWFFVNFNDFFMILPISIAVTFALQCIFSLFLIAIYWKNTESIFKKRYIGFDIIVLCLSYGASEAISCFNTFIVKEISEDEQSFAEKIALTMIASVGLFRFLFSSCIQQIMKARNIKLYKEAIRSPLIENKS